MCADRARKQAGQADAQQVRRYSGTLPYRDAPEEIADSVLQVGNGERPGQASFEAATPYRKAFRQGATLVPRMLCLVEQLRIGRIGFNPQMPLVRSRRSTQEKRPWKALPAIDHAVEAQFLRPVLLGESILPFRVFRPFTGVVAVDDKGNMLDNAAALREGRVGLAAWIG